MIGLILALLNIVMAVYHLVLIRRLRRATEWRDRP